MIIIIQRIFWHVESLYIAEMLDKPEQALFFSHDLSDGKHVKSNVSSFNLLNHVLSHISRVKIHAIVYDAPLATNASCVPVEGERLQHFTRKAVVSPPAGTSRESYFVETVPITVNVNSKIDNYHDGMGSTCFESEDFQGQNSVLCEKNKDIESTKCRKEKKKKKAIEEESPKYKKVNKRKKAIDEESVKKRSPKNISKKVKVEPNPKKRKRCPSPKEEVEPKKVKTPKNVKSKPAKSKSVPKIEPVISSSESDSEEDIDQTETKSKNARTPKATKKAISTTKTAQKPVIKAEKTSSSSCSSSDEDEEQGLWLKGKVNSKNSGGSDDSEVERKAAANAEAERQLEELLSKVDEKTRTRRRRRKRENQKRRRRDKMLDNSYVDVSGQVNDSFTEQQHAPDVCLLHEPAVDNKDAEAVLSGDAVNGPEDLNNVDSFAKNQHDDFDAEPGKDYKRGKTWQKNQFHIMTKEEQLNSAYTNYSYIYEVCGIHLNVVNSFKD
jgi:hypothetical protein